MFYDKATLYVNSCVNLYNCRTRRGSQQPNEVFEYVRDSSKLNVWCGLIHDRVIGPTIFAENTITVAIYLDMLELYVIPQSMALREKKALIQLLNLTSAIVRKALNIRFPGNWIGRNGAVLWPPKSPNLMPLEFFHGVTLRI